MLDPLAPLSDDPNAWVFIDVETRSTHDVTIHGAARHNANGRVTVVAYAIGDGPVKDWVLEDWTPGRKLDWADAPDDLLDALQEVEEGRKWFVAHNCSFEYYAFTRGMVGLEDFRVEWMIDSMAQALRSHLPADLAGAAKAVGLTQKQASGKALIRLFAVEGNGVTPQSHPVEWAQFREYARDDVAAMRDVFFATMPLHRRMWEEFWASERINHRGVAVDLPFVRGAAALATRLMATANADVERLTRGAIKTVRQNAALLGWIRTRLSHLPEVDRILTREFEIVEDDEGERESVPKYSLGREIVEALMAYLEKLDEAEGLTDDEWAVLQVLEVRLYGASATPAKFQKILDTVDLDGRLKSQYIYCGAGTTRFSSKGVQIHNLSRDTVGSLDDEIDAIELIAAKGADAYDEIKARWGYVGKVLSRLIRPAFVAPEGQTLVFTDLSSIEAVVCPWLTDDEDAEPLLEAIRANHRDPSNPDMYRVQAGKMLGKDPFEITKGERQSHGKTVQLACQFLGGKGSLFNMGRIYRVHFEDDEAAEIIDRWRGENKWAMRFGDRIWESILWCMENPGEPRSAGRVTLVYDDTYLRGTLFMVLPNGDPLLYTGIAWREVKIKDKQSGEEKVETRLTVRKGRGIASIWKGEIVNNATQATAAALLRNALRVLDDMGSPVVVAHTHDEIMVQTPVGEVDRADEALLRVMTERPDWAPGLPIAAEPTRCDWYTKTLG
jgi:DNA polymerase